MGEAAAYTVDIPASQAVAVGEMSKRTAAAISCAAVGSSQTETARATAVLVPKDNPASSSKAGWSKVREGMKQLSVIDALRSAHQIPSGFRVSTLAELGRLPQHRLSTWLLPTLNSSGLAYADLHLNYHTGSLRGEPVDTSRCFSMVEAVDIPYPTGMDGVTIVGRQLRVVLFNKQKFLSNVLALRVGWSEENPTTWKFNKLGVSPGFDEKDSVCLCRSKYERSGCSVHYTYTDNSLFYVLFYLLP